MTAPAAIGAVLRGAEPAAAYEAWLAALARSGWEPRLPAERVPLDAAAGRVLAGRLAALAPNPPHRCAAMDGYALTAADGAGPLAAGTYLRIDTGQPVDDRFDAVAQIEIAHESAAGLVLERALAAGTNVRAAGEDVQEGDELLPAGRLLSAYDVALAAVAGHGELDVVRRPRVAILPTGGELRPPGTRLAPGEVADADGPMLQALARAAGALCERLPPRPDDAALIGAAVLEAARTSDLVLVIAGSSRGRADHTASVLERHGELVVHGVALRPAHPVALGTVEGTPVIGIPGYPVAAAVAFERFARPLLEHLLGALPEDAPLIRVRLIGEVRAKRAVEVYVPLIVSDGHDLPNALPQSRKGGALRGLAGAHALLCTRLDDGFLPVGTEVEARLLRPWPRA
ncbi:MAG TPA: molybdopterin molybdotransferase MoeA [Gaiellales bacterium]|jgi:molybdenum cofactor synthesis domain-containing protein